MAPAYGVPIESVATFITPGAIRNVFLKMLHADDVLLAEPLILVAFTTHPAVVWMPSNDNLITTLLLSPTASLGF